LSKTVVIFLQKRNLLLNKRVILTVYRHWRTLPYDLNTSLPVALSVLNIPIIERKTYVSALLWVNGIARKKIPATIWSSSINAFFYAWLTIIASSGSYARQYAERNKIKFKTR